MLPEYRIEPHFDECMHSLGNAVINLSKQTVVVHLRVNTLQRANVLVSHCELVD